MTVLSGKKEVSSVWGRKERRGFAAILPLLDNWLQVSFNTFGHQRKEDLLHDTW
jgi:hypothetical protein